MSEFELLIDLLRSVGWGQAGAAIIMGALYVVSSHYDLGDIAPTERRTIARLIGWALIWLSVGQFAGSYTGGLAEYIRDNDAPVWGIVVLCTRLLSLSYFVRALFASLYRWRLRSKGQ